MPGHWLAFGQRHSPLTSSPRLAANPANAILNYLYALLEVETTLALHTVGVDPLLGLFHTDKASRPSLTLDVMEPVRPVVDAYVLALLRERTLRPSDFAETRRGACRILTELATTLTQTIDTWRRHIAPIAEQVAHTFASASDNPRPAATPLTGNRRAAAWAQRRAPRPAKALPPAVMANACRECGIPLSDRRRRYCDACRRERFVEQGAEVGRENAAKVLTQLRAQGNDPAHGGEAARRRGAKNAVHQRALREWVAGAAPEFDKARFAEEIQPRLRAVPVADVVAATGLSAHYCSLIRLGKRTPHRRHWPTLDSLVGQLAAPT
jgi:hypothetical protein